MRRILTTVFMSVLVLAFAGAIVPAVAQSLQGMAIAHAPEGGFHGCHDGRPETALNCARQKCREGGGEGCLRVRWCYPAGFSGAMSYLANREITQETFLCGAPSEAALLRMLAAHCAAVAEATECRLIAMWAPDGTETVRTDHLGKNTAD
ncbi:MAG: hypothetical protein AAFW98_07160 [Pseudomonadota bacterium]